MSVPELTPADHDKAEPCRRSDFSDDDVAWNFEENVWYKEHEESNIEVMTMHIEVFLESLEYMSE